MAKVTVYLTDDQMERLKMVKGAGRGGVSKLFQAFVESATGGGPDPAGRYDYARQLMPTLAAIERHRRRLARKVQAGGPPADGGPVSVALTILLYRRLVESDPTLAATFDKEFARFGLDELVASETEGVDLLAEPEEDEDGDEELGDDWERGAANMANFGPLGIRIGDEVREAMKQMSVIRENLRDLSGERPARPERPERPGRPERPERPERHRRRAARRLVIEVTADDDPRDLLSVNDFATFTSRHPDWDAGSRLSPSQMESVRELLIRRAGGDPDAEEDIEPAGPGEAPGEAAPGTVETEATEKDPE